MSNKIDLSKFEIRTDLVFELIEASNLNGINTVVKKYEDIEITSVTIDKKISKDINKKEGKYTTITFDDISDYDSRQKVINVFKETFENILIDLKIKNDASCLIVGLGNDKVTADSLGPKTIENIVITKHMFDLPGIAVDKSFRNICGINPGVMGETGIETSRIVYSLVKEIKPDFVIVIDALAASNINRVNKTIQISDAGINPGSGVGNNRKELSKKVLGVPVIAIGIPTVVDAVTIVADTMNYMTNHFSYHIENKHNLSHKFTTIDKIKIDDKKELNKENRKKLLGLIGNFEDSEIRDLLTEVLSPLGLNMMVSPKEIDFVIKNLSEVLSKGINMTLHRQITRH
ncbi:MAG: GPR endopeptidase [Bacilli bacterium]